MSDDEIIQLYRIGKSVDFIADKYYKKINSNVKKNHYANGNYVITKKTISKYDAKHYVEVVIYNYVMKLFKED